MSSKKLNLRLQRMQMHLKDGLEARNVTATEGRDFEIATPWGFLRGKEWGISNKEEGTVALHGLLDNCSSFDRLAPLLPPHIHFVAYDFPGYGLSTPYPPGGYQTKEMYLVDFQRVVSHFGWKTVNVVGHSLGGAVALCIGASISFVSRTILLDPAKALSSVGARQPDYLVNFASLITQLEEQGSPTQRSRTVEEAVQAIVAKSRNSLTVESARILAKRGTRVVDPQKGLVIFNTDPKNILGLQPMFEEVGSMAFARCLGMNCDTLLLTSPEWAIPDWAIGLDSVSRQQYFVEVAKYGRLTHLQVEGSHHVHLNNPQRVSALIAEFLQHSKIDLSNPKNEFTVINY